MPDGLTHHKSEELVGGSLCLDFCNTVQERPEFRRAGGGIPQGDLFSSYADLLAWAEQAKVLPHSITERLALSAHTFPQLAEQTLRRGLQLREQLFTLFSTGILTGKFHQQHLEALNSSLRTLPARQLQQRNGMIEWLWRLEEGNFEAMLAPITFDAAELLTTVSMDRLRICSDEHCSWIFIDTSKNGKRRWCSMSACGNRDKVRRFYLRHESGQSAK